MDLSGSLRERQAATLAAHADVVAWADALPEALSGVVVGNEVLDAMPVQLLNRVGGQWFERGVPLDADQCLQWADRRTDLRPPLDIEGPQDYLTEIHPRLKPLCARWPSACSAAQPSSLITVFQRLNISTRSATWAR